MFNSNNNGYSLADIAAATGGNGNNGFGFGDGGGILALILFVAFMMFGGVNGFGGGIFGNGLLGGGRNGGGTTVIGTPQAVSTMNTDYLAQGMRDIQSNLASNFLTLNNESMTNRCDILGAIADSTAAITAATTNGFAAQTLAGMQNTNAIQQDINANTVAGMQNAQALQATLAQMASDHRADTAQLSYNQATNTCAINTNAANNTRDIVEAINNGNQMLANMLQQNKFDAMQDKINDLTSQLQTAQFAASQGAQTNAIVNQLRTPNPVPAYVVSNPYCNCNNNGYGYNIANV